MIHSVLTMFGLQERSFSQSCSLLSLCTWSLVEYINYLIILC